MSMDFKMFLERWGGDDDDHVYWIPPSKQLIKFSIDISHARYVLQNPELFGFTFEELKDIEKEDVGVDIVTRTAIANGSTRIYISDDELVAQTTPHNIKRHKELIEELIVTHDIKVILVDYYQGNTHLTPFKKFTAEEFFDL